MLAPALIFVALNVTYATEKIEGWTVHVDRGTRSPEHREAWRIARRELESQLYRINRVVGDAPLAEIKKVPIWVHVKGPWTACMAYHPSREWLRDNGLNPDMAKGIEIGNIRAFADWTYEQPWMVLHELAHAYHDRFLPDGFSNAEVKAAYDASMAVSRYDSVRHHRGGMSKHYATTNPMEYFAEASEAYFGTNDFFPFVWSELKAHDPEGFALMEKIWGPKVKRLAPAPPQ